MICDYNEHIISYKYQLFSRGGLYLHNGRYHSEPYHILYISEYNISELLQEKMCISPIYIRDFVIHDQLLYVSTYGSKYPFDYIDIYAINLETKYCNYIPNLPAGTLFVSKSCVYTWNCNSYILNIYNEITKKMCTLYHKTHTIFYISDKYIYSGRYIEYDIEHNKFLFQTQIRSINSLDIVIDNMFCHEICFNNKYCSLSNIHELDTIIVSHYDIIH